MLTIQKNNTDIPAMAVLHLSGEATIEQADQLREALLTGLSEHDHLAIDCTGLARIDFFALQLICSAHRTSVSRKKSFTWHDGKSPTVLEAERKNGFSRHHGCPLCPPGVKCMWE